MIQTARSGKQNIAEGSKVAKTSTEIELKLTNVARASLEELLIECQNFLCTRIYAIWEKDSKEALFVRKLGLRKEESYEDYRAFADTRSTEIVADIALCLVHQANSLLDKQIVQLEKSFLENGGLLEQMTRARIDYRNQNRK